MGVPRFQRPRRRLSLRGAARSSPAAESASAPARPPPPGGAAPPGRASAGCFFATSAQLATAVDHLRMALIQDNGASRIVWGAGCGAGHELYSFLIATVEELGPLTDRLRFLGSDPDASSLAIARAGVYDRDELRGVRRSIVRRHFQREERGRYAIHPRHRARLELHRADVHDLALLLPAGSVLIALHRDTSADHDTEALVSRHRLLAERLAPGGLLVQAPLAPAPTTSGSWQPLAPGVFVKGRMPFSSAPPIPSHSRPISVRPGGIASTLPPPPQQSATRGRISGAVELGQHGDIPGALSLATEALRLEPNGPLAYLVRAQLHLAGGSIEGALDDLRRLLFLAPSCRLARYWYGLALQAAQLTERASAQLEELERQLAQADDAELLEDDVSTVADLRRALASLRRGGPSHALQEKGTPQ